MIQSLPSPSTLPYDLLFRAPLVQTAQGTKGPLFSSLRDLCDALADKSRDRLVKAQQQPPAKKILSDRYSSNISQRLSSKRKLAARPPEALLAEIRTVAGERLGKDMTKAAFAEALENAIRCLGKRRCVLSPSTISSVDFLDTTRYTTAILYAQGGGPILEDALQAPVLQNLLKYRLDLNYVNVVQLLSDADYINPCWGTLKLMIWTKLRSVLSRNVSEGEVEEIVSAARRDSALDVQVTNESASERLPGLAILVSDDEVLVVPTGSEPLADDHALAERIARFAEAVVDRLSVGAAALPPVPVPV